MHRAGVDCAGRRGLGRHCAGNRRRGRRCLYIPAGAFFENPPAAGRMKMIRGAPVLQGIFGSVTRRHPAHSAHWINPHGGICRTSIGCGAVVVPMSGAVHGGAALRWSVVHCRDPDVNPLRDALDDSPSRSNPCGGASAGEARRLEPAWVGAVKTAADHEAVAKAYDAEALGFEKKAAMHTGWSCSCTSTSRTTGGRPKVG